MNPIVIVILIVCAFFLGHWLGSSPEWVSSLFLTYPGGICRLTTRHITRLMPHWEPGCPVVVSSLVVGK